MAEPTLNGKQPPQALKPNLSLYLAIPAVQGAGISDEDWLAECETMFNHSRMVQQFVMGKISPQDFEDSIADLGFDPYQIEEAWEEGRPLL